MKPSHRKIALVAAASLCVAAGVLGSRLLSRPQPPSPAASTPTDRTPAAVANPFGSGPVQVGGADSASATAALRPPAPGVPGAPPAGPSSTSAPEDAGSSSLTRPENAKLAGDLQKWSEMQNQLPTAERRAMAKALLADVAAKLDQRQLQPMEAAMISMALLPDAEPNEAAREARIKQLQEQLQSQVPQQ